MEEADTSDGICDISLGREIMQAVRQNDPMRPPTREDHCHHHRQHRRQFDSTTTSEETSTNELNDDMDEYLDEALDDDFEEESIGQVNFESRSSFRHAIFNFDFSFTFSEKDRYVQVVFHMKKIHEDQPRNNWQSPKRMKIQICHRKR